MTSPRFSIDRSTPSPCSPAPGRAGHGRAAPGRRGFVLIAVIWSLGLITVLGSAAIVGARFRGRATADIVAEAKAAAAADSGVALGLLQVLRDSAGPDPAVPLRCGLPDGSRLVVAVADEAGKVDLNMAPVALLTRLFAGLTGDDAQGGRIAAEVAAFREPSRDPVGQAILERYALDEKPEGPKRAAFVTVFELDQVAGVSHALFRAALPFVSVSARRGDVDFGRATPALRRLLGVKQGAATPTPLQDGRHSVTVTADATTPEGARFVREALVSIGGGEGEPYVIHEWRRGDVGLDDQGDADPSPCFPLAP